MPRVTLNVQLVKRTGLAVSYSSAQVDGNAFPNSGREFIHVRNGGPSPITVEVLTARTVDGQEVDNRTVSVPNGSDRMIGPFPAGNYNQSTGEVWFNYSGVTSVTVAAIRA